MPCFAQLKVLVPTPGTPVPLSTSIHTAHSIQVQPILANAGSVYVGIGGLVKGTLVNVMAVLPKPSSSTSGPLPPWSAANEAASNGISVQEVFIDADNANDGVIVTIIQA